MDESYDTTTNMERRGGIFIQSCIISM